MTNERLGGQIALVTGASRGIGAACARALAAAGAHVVLTARTEGGLAATEEAIAAAGGTATIAPLDLIDGAGIERLGPALMARWGRLDLLVLNAGLLGSLTPVAHADPDEVAKVFSVNVLANQRLLRAVDPLLRASPAGRVVAMSSGAAARPRAYWGPYAASKAALEALVLAYAAEVGAISRVRVAIMNPGATATAMRARAYPGEDAATLKPPEAVAARLVELLGDDFDTGARVG